MNTCPRCQKQFEGNFCPACGHKIADVCPACGAKRSGDYQFCSICGSPFDSASRPSSSRFSANDIFVKLLKSSHLILFTLFTVLVFAFLASPAIEFDYFYDAQSAFQCISSGDDTLIFTALGMVIAAVLSLISSVVLWLTHSSPIRATGKRVLQIVIMYFNYLVTLASGIIAFCLIINDFRSASPNSPIKFIVISLIFSVLTPIALKLSRKLAN